MDSINEPLRAFVTSVLFPFIEVPRESRRASAQRCKRCVHIIVVRINVWERRGVYIRDVYERPIRSTADVEHIEKTFKRYDATFPYRFWHRPADSLAAAGRRETNGLYFAELSLVPANYLNFSSPQMSPLRRRPLPLGRRPPNYMDHCWFFMAGKWNDVGFVSRYVSLLATRSALFGHDNASVYPAE